MTTSQTHSSGLCIDAPMSEVRQAKRDATQRLLGATMNISDVQWQSPSLLPGWTRAHVATHLARGAQALGRVASALVNGEQPGPLYESRENRISEIERGSERPGVELQIDMDTAAGELHEIFDALDPVDPATPVILGPGILVHAHELPSVRLAEVVLHHVDLDINFDLRSLDDLSARILLQWVCFRLHNRADVPALRIVSDSGYTDRIGSNGFATTVHGSDAELAGWLSGRDNSSSLTGAEHLVIPLLS